MEKEKATSPEKKAALGMIRYQLKGTASKAQAERLSAMPKPLANLDAAADFLAELERVAGAGHEQELQAQ